MVDVVANHAGAVPDYDFSQITPFNDASNYHDDCEIKDWSDQWQVENCWLFGLPDLKQEDPATRKGLLDWIQKLVSDYGFDGIRIDTVSEVPKDFWKEFGDAAGVFQMGEVSSPSVDYVAPYQNYLTGTFNYPMYYTIRDVFANGKSMTLLSKLF